MTDLLEIRPITTKDFDTYKIGYDNRLPPQNEFDVGKPPEITRKYFYDYLSSMADYARQDKIYVFGAFLKETNQLVGFLEIIILLRNGISWGSLGVSVHNQFWGKGYGSEIVFKGTDIAKSMLKIRRLECAIEPNNTRSEDIFKKLGFTFECTRKNFYPMAQGNLDMNIFYKML